MSKLGSFLKETREAQGLGYEKVTQETKMSEDIIKQLEDGGFAELPSYNHAKNFVKNYAEYLGLDPDDTMSMLQEECTRETFSKEPQIVFSPEFPPKEDPENSSFLMKYVLPVVVIALIIFAGTKLFFSVKGAKKAPEPVVSEQQQTPEPSAAQQVPAQDDTTFNTVDPKTVEKTIEEVNSAEEKAQAEANAEVKPEDAATADADKTKTDDTTKENKAVKTGNMAILNFADVCWVHVKSDTGEELDFIASRGSHKEVSFKQFFILDVGNAAVASVNFNGRTIAGLGGYKQPAKGLKFEPNESGVLKYSVVK
ncbi:MAG: helix-turn-helix domain-containing protein [Deferribacterales bacterium]